MKTLNIGTGKKEYNLGDKVTVTFNPTDMDFVERAVDAIRQSQDKQKETEAEIARVREQNDTAGLFDVARRRDAEIRTLVNDLFGMDVCTPLFDTMNIFSRCDGFPQWANVLTAVLDECYDNLPQEDKATRDRIAKYTRKYKK